MDDQKYKEEEDEIIPPVPRLDDLCVQVIAENYHEYPVIDKILPQYVDSVVALLDPTLISLETAAKYIESEKFWKRMCQKWKNCQAEHHGSSWKRLYLELNLQELLEAYTPAKDEKEDQPLEEKKSVEYENLMRDVQASKSLVHTLKIRQFLSHLDLNDLFKDFPNLSTLDLTYGAKNVGMDYDKSLFGMKLTDVMSLANLLTNTTTLTRLILSQNLLNDESIHVLMSGLSKNETLTALDLSHNKIGDLGARRLARLVEGQNVLTSLSLADNMIHTQGAKYLGKALRVNHNLIHLDLRLNAIGDEGGKAIFECLKDNTSLQSLNLAANHMNFEAGRSLVIMLHHNRTLRELDVSCNNVADEGGKNLKAALLENTSLNMLDLRKNEIDETNLEEIKKILRARQVEFKRERRKRLQNPGREWTD
eukprot:TRINITY_DN7286_c0_g1_i3.p1 TRINITY_DN7286_c0_g1~~TRINITY_DN7286_c0_g1_i3.p1  ORF type:complete len:422 (+),score=81.13 TRINITY_DN7286_c0_g1_i3:82-1347(+)